MAQSGILKGIAFKTETYAPMELRKKTMVSKKNGVENDYLGKPGPRQVTVLSLEAWYETCQELECQLPWTARRANLLVSGINLMDSIGKTLKIGNVELEITGGTDPCERMEKTYPGLQNALKKNWRGGVSCKVVQEGIIRENELVQLCP